MRPGCAWMALGILWSSTSIAGDSPATPSFEQHVMPLLRARCVKCHGPAKREAKLNLATPKGLARGGENGEVIVAGRLDESLLWEKVEAGEMPPKEPLSDDEKALLRRWIEGGSPGLPRVSPGDPEGADFWAFAPASRPRIPEVRIAERIRTPIDRFIQAALEAKGLALGPEANRATLIRRVSLDLTGLPPTAKEVVKFLSDPAPDAYEQMVDRTLASPQYGERWGKHWLDAAGYADSNGYFNADTDRPLAYRYRDYVIKSWNEDKPFDRFLLEQLAGDELAGYRPGGKVTPETIELLVATHFLRNAPDGTGESDGNPDEVRADQYAVLEGTTQILGSALFGLTLQCARCHDHKFEPISQKDYYQIYAVLWPAFDLEKWVKPQQRIVEAPLPDELAAWQAKSHRLDAELFALKNRHVFTDPFVDPSGKRGKALAQGVQAIDAQRGERPGRIAWVADLSSSPSNTPLLTRGRYTDPGAKVEPGPPAILADRVNPFAAERPSEPALYTARRLAFARWLTRPASRPAALLARVTANRLWQQHFGTGLIASSENLGYSGAPASHPELLEWLASELAESGWRIKSWHRLILLSSTYRQASSTTEKALRADPENRLLSRYPVRRLDAETIRDAMLAASGELDLRIGGTYVPTKVVGTGEVVVDEGADGAGRRAVYLQQRRTQVPSMLEVFDAPSIVTNCTRRSSSTMPLQSLSLLNSAFVSARAHGLATRLNREAGSDPDARISYAFLQAIGREPDDTERATARQFVQTQPSRYPNRTDADAQAWIDLCQMILVSNASLYVE
jgi:hypothetical protein